MPRNSTKANIPTVTPDLDLPDPVRDPRLVDARRVHAELAERRPQLAGDLDAAQFEEDRAAEALEAAELAHHAGRAAAADLEDAQRAFIAARKRRAALYYELKDLDAELADSDLAEVEYAARKDAAKQLRALYTAKVSDLLALLDAASAVSAQVGAIYQRADDVALAYPYRAWVNRQDGETDAQYAGSVAADARLKGLGGARCGLPADMSLPELADQRRNPRQLNQSRFDVWRDAALDALKQLDEAAA